MFHAAKAFNQDLSKWKLSEDLKEYENFNVAGHKDFNRQKLPHGLVITQYVREALEPVFKDRFHKQMTYQDVEDKIREFNNSSHNDVKLVGIE
ncbi:hypothetical protein JIY74_28435 [Vibrio harveyi]|nr:hypothetical protein [Vibrio harveyi]